MRVLIRDNLEEVISKNAGDIHINDIIHWANKHEYHIIPNGIILNDDPQGMDDVEFDSYVVQDVSKEKGREASDAAILYFDSDALLQGYLMIH